MKSVKTHRGLTSLLVCFVLFSSIACSGITKSAMSGDPREFGKEKTAVLAIKGQEQFQ